jgi:dTDP-4-amino-4,6-dideoxygalactose transaminase
MIPFVNLKSQYQSIKDEIDIAISDVIRETSFIGGKHVKDFENNFRDKIGVRNVVSCANGTDSLYIILKMLGVGIGDEVITAANSWISSSETISQVGATPVFCDIREIDFCLDVDKLEELINPKTKAIVAVHLYGHMCSMKELTEICQRRGIYLVEDCAQAHFSEYQGSYAGKFGIAASFSFYPGKNLGAYGDGGCIITNNDDLAQKCRMFANHGALVKHEHEMEGINSRLDGMQAAILNVKLKYIDQWTAQRITNAELYKKYLADILEIQLPIVASECKHTFHLFVIKCQKRDELREFLKEKGIETAIHYPRALPNLPAYENLNKISHYPVATELENKILSLPMFPELKENEIIYISERIRDFYKQQ